MGLHRGPDRHQGNNFTPTVLTTQIKLLRYSPVSSLKNRVLNQTLGTRDTVGPGGSSRKAGARQGGRNATPAPATAEPGKGRSRLASVRCDSKCDTLHAARTRPTGPCPSGVHASEGMALGEKRHERACGHAGIRDAGREVIV